MRIVANAFVAWAILAPAAFAGWDELFNGRDLNGWDPQTKANWTVRDGAISVSEGRKGLLTSKSTYRDFELELEFKADKGSHSGVLLCSPKEVTDPATECYEVAIAPESSNYPTGSLTGRARHGGAGEFSGWRKLRVKVDGGKVEVWLDGQRTVQYEDRRALGFGYIGLEYDQGRVEFRNIRVQKIDLP